jgi:hypothetical protein
MRPAGIVEFRPASTVIAIFLFVSPKRAIHQCASPASMLAGILVQAEVGPEINPAHFLVSRQ